MERFEEPFTVSFIVDARGAPRAWVLWLLSFLLLLLSLFGDSTSAVPLTQVF